MSELEKIDTSGAYLIDRALGALEGIESGTRFVPGQRLDLKLVEANAITGSLRFELPLPEGDDGASRAMRRDRVKMGRRAGQSRIPKGIRRGR